MCVCDYISYRKIWPYYLSLTAWEEDRNALALGLACSPVALAGWSLDILQTRLGHVNSDPNRSSMMINEQAKYGAS